MFLSHSAKSIYDDFEAVFTVLQILFIKKFIR